MFRGYPHPALDKYFFKIILRNEERTRRLFNIGLSVRSGPVLLRFIK